jgi:hypothetical protein
VEAAVDGELRGCPAVAGAAVGEAARQLSGLGGVAGLDGEARDQPAIRAAALTASPAGDPSRETAWTRCSIRS